MNRNYTDILFAIYMSGGQATMRWLVEFYLSGRQDTQRRIGTLASAQLLTLSLSDNQVHVALTEKGTLAALAAADILSGKMIEQWQQDKAA